MKTPEYKSDRQKYCQDCGTVIPRIAEICPRCGGEQHVVQRTQTVIAPSQPLSRNRIIYGILGIALGGLGVHRFYAGQWKLALIYLLFSWTMIPGLIGFIEGVLALIQSDDKFDQKLMNYSKD